MSRTIEQFIAYGEETGIVGAIGRRGCSPTEIEVLEQKCGLGLPHAYREYLAVMGSDSSRLFTHDHTLASYNHVLQLFEALRDETAEDQQALRGTLPADGLMIASRLGDVIWFIRCHHALDSPVWRIIAPDFQPVQVAESFVEWLFGWAWEAKAAIESGWYSRPQ